MRMFLVVRINVDTPYCVGNNDAVCMKAPMFELVIGNIQSSRSLEEPYRNETDEAPSVTIRAEEKKSNKTESHYKFQKNLGLQEPKEVQKKDPLL